jgi:hypothetical protein
MGLIPNERDQTPPRQPQAKSNDYPHRYKHKI